MRLASKATLEPDSLIDPELSEDDQHEEKPKLQEFSLLGVPVSFFEEFVQKHCGGRTKLLNKTTKDVCESHIKPLTESTGLSLCKHLLHKGTSVKIQPAKWFVSHAWKFRFVDVVDAIQKFMADEGLPRSTVVWFDLFSNSQHNTEDHPFEWWTGTFMNAIKTIGNVVMVLAPWNDPIPLTRAWCVFELYASVETKSTFRVAMTDAEATTFLETLRRQPRQFFKLLGTIKSEKSEAYVLMDQERIHEVIRQTVGFTKMDRQLFDKLVEWIETKLLSLVESCTQDQEAERLEWKQSLAHLYKDVGKKAVSEKVFNECLTGRKKTLGEDHIETVRTAHALATLYARQSQHKEAEALYDYSLEKMTAMLGESHPETITFLSDLACLYRDQGRYELAMQVYEKCLQLRRNTLGEDHPDTLTSMHHLSSMLFRQGRTDGAVAYELHCLTRRRHILGHDHPSTLASLNTLSKLYTALGKYEKAESFAKDCFERRERIFGLDHQQTIDSVRNLASIHQSRGLLREAEALYNDCLERCRRSLGDDHAETLFILTDLAEVYAKQGKFEQAEQIHINCFERRQLLLGEHHPDTLSSLGSLADLYHSYGKYEFAEPYYMSSLQKRFDLHGKDHPETIQASQNLTKFYDVREKKATYSSAHIQERQIMLDQRSISRTTHRTSSLRSLTTVSRKSSTTSYSSDSFEAWDQTLDDAEFKSKFRLGREEFFWLVEQLSEHTIKSQKKAGKVLSIEHQLAITLYRLGHGEPYNAVGALFGVKQSIAETTTIAMVNLIKKVLYSQAISWPSLDDLTEWTRIEEGFRSLCDLSGIVGAIGTTHIPLKKPAGDKFHKFINYKGWASIQLQGVVDASGEFRNLYGGDPGSKLAPQVLKSSPISQKPSYGMPKSKYLIGDGRYHASGGLILAPYSGTSAHDSAEAVFNKNHSQALNILERAFKQVKGRFRILLTPQQAPPDTVRDVAICCFVLHNILNNRPSSQYVLDWDTLAERERLYSQHIGAISPATTAGVKTSEDRNMAAARNKLASSMCK